MLRTSDKMKVTCQMRPQLTRLLSGDLQSSKNVLFHCTFQPVWPDVEVKSSPNISKSGPKSSHISFYLKSNVFSKCSKSYPTFGLLLKENLSPIIIKNCSILSHWLQRSIDRRIRRISWAWLSIVWAIGELARNLSSPNL